MNADARLGLPRDPGAFPALNDSPAEEGSSLSFVEASDALIV